MSSEPDSPVPLSVSAKALRFARLLLRPSFGRKLVTLATDGYLAETGWVRSASSGTVVDSAGRPVPWATQPYIDFITPRLGREWMVFEYGSGSSTRFYAGRVGQVLAVEHDAAFAAALVPELPCNARLVVRPAGSPAYAEAVVQCAPAPAMVVVDGRDRVRCVEMAWPRLAPGGVLVLDDAERPDYAPARESLRIAGFRVIEFWGLTRVRQLRKRGKISFEGSGLSGVAACEAAASAKSM